MEYLRDILVFAISIFTIMNPLSAGAVMLTLVDDTTTIKEFSQIATKTAKVVFISMLIIFLSGTYIFNFFGISADSLRVFGGIILLMMGINMVRGKDKVVNHSAQEKEPAMNKEDITIVPLGIPIIVGPGLATTLATMSVEAVGVVSNLLVIAAILICSAATYIILKRMPYIKRRLGVNGLKVFNRLMGLVVGAIATQMILAGTVALTKTYVGS